jgi:hypothetical protein
MNRFNARNEKGFALISVMMVSFILLALTGATYARAFIEAREVERTLEQSQSNFAAEAGIQLALVQINSNGFTGFINTDTTVLNGINFQDIQGNPLGNFNVNIAYPGQADWVTIRSSFTVDGNLTTLEGRVFLDSNLSKYMVYADASNVGLGASLKLGYNDGINPGGVSGDEFDRAAVYGTGDITFYGNNIEVYGDIHAEDNVVGNSTSTVHGDVYSTNFDQDIFGNVIATGVSGNLTINDGFNGGNDNFDRNGDQTIDVDDAPDHHALTADGNQDAHKIEVIDPLNLAFYEANNSVPALSGGNKKKRYLKFEVDPDPNNQGSTRILEYKNAKFEGDPVIHDNLPKNAIVYVKGDAYVQGEIEGRVSVVASDDLVFYGNMTYAESESYSDENHSAAYIAKDKIFLHPKDIEISGILYAEKGNSNGSVALDAGYGNPKNNGHFRLFGNVVIKGTANTSLYGPNRIYGYDENLKHYRPPGIPVTPDLRTVRQA